MACLKRRPASAGCCPPHGRRCRRHLEGGNYRIGSTRSGLSCGFGPDVAPRCPSGPTRHNRVERSTGQSPSVQSQRALTSGPLHPVVSGRPRGTPGSNIRARPTATSTPCRPDASVSPLRVPAAAPSVRGGTHRRRVLGVCNRLNTSRLVRGRLRKILRYATPRRPPATVVDVRRAIRVEGSVQILLHHKKL